MVGGGGSGGVRGLVILKLGCATTLDSSLRCAPFRMTGKGRCVRMTKDEGAPFNDRIDLLYFCHFKLSEKAEIGDWRVAQRL